MTAEYRSKAGEWLNRAAERVTATLAPGDTAVLVHNDTRVQVRYGDTPSHVCERWSWERRVGGSA